MDWKKQFTNEFGIHFSNSELQFALTFIQDLLDKQKSEIRKKAQLLMAEEIMIAHKDGQRTSRLTSFAVKFANYLE